MCLWDFGRFSSAMCAVKTQSEDKNVQPGPWKWAFFGTRSYCSCRSSSAVEPTVEPPLHRHTHRLYCTWYDSSYYFHIIFFSSVSIGGGCPDEVGGGGFGICPRDCLKNSDCSQNNSLCCPAACGGHRCLVRCPKLTCSKACSTGYTLVNNCPTCKCKGEQAFFWSRKNHFKGKRALSLLVFFFITVINSRGVECMMPAGSTLS